LNIIMGGIQASVNAKQKLENPSVDAVAIGEAEDTFAELVSTFREHGWMGITENPPIGLAINKNGKCVFSERPLKENLDDFPIPAYGLLPGFPEKYSARMITSRGCGFRCPYCASTVYWGHKFRAHSPQRVLDEMMLLRDKWGIHRVSFSDDTFNQDPVRARKIAQLLIDADMKVEWGASCRAELLNEDDLRLYAESGMSGLFLGLESGSPEILKSISRHHGLDRTRLLIELAESLGIEVHASFMIGLPDEREDDIEMTIKYAESLHARTLGFHIFHPLPGCEYALNPEKYGIKTEFTNTESEFACGIGDIDSIAPVKTKYLDPMRIVHYYDIVRSMAEKKFRK
jgi:anaerobic magnesium-protoporphyrin IX monomethyl ester cyclase